MIAKAGCEISPIEYPKESRVPLFEEKLEQLRTRLTQIMVDKLPELNESLGKIAEARKMQAEGQAMKVEGQAMKAEGQAMRAEGLRQVQEAEQKLQELAKEKQNVIARQFYSIFSKNSLTVGEINEISKNYLGNDSLTFEKSPEGPCNPKLNSMNAVTRFLADHPNVKTCDFRIFKDKVCDIPTLAEFLKKSTVIAVAFKNSIPQAAKESLAEAVAARKGGLRVQYFA